MQRFTKGVLLLVASLLSLGGCGTIKSDFDYAAGATETAQVVLPEPMRVRNLDGRAIKLPLLLKFPYTMTVPAGVRSLEFQYGENWGRGEGSEKIRGPIMAVEFDAKAGERYEVDFRRAEAITDLSLAEDYVNSFEAWLLDTAGERVDARSTGNFGGWLK